jgi:TPR repeat protein
LAIEWYTKAAEQGEPAAQYHLGLMYAQGQGIPMDYVKAADWYRQAAEQGNAAAQNGLGVLYAQGQGVQPDMVQAYRWFAMAAESGNATALENRDIAEGQMTNPPKLRILLLNNVKIQIKA